LIAAWRAQIPGSGKSRRTIAAIFALLQNNRLSWIKSLAPHLKCPAALDTNGCTMKEAAAAHKKSTAQCLLMLLGYRLPTGTAYSIWQWDKLWKQVGFKTRPR
jgi:hypothetical protein